MAKCRFSMLIMAKTSHDKVDTGARTGINVSARVIHFLFMIVSPVSMSFSALFGKADIAFPAPFDTKITGNHEGSMKSVVFYIFFITVCTGVAKKIETGQVSAKIFTDRLGS